MARSKARSRRSTNDTPGTTGTEGTTATERVHKMAGLTAEEIQSLLGKTRQKGLYVERLNEFVNSGEMGVCANEQWVDFRDKKDSTLKQGFEGAKDKKEAAEGSDQIKVVTNEGKVFLINLAVAGEALGAELAGAAA